jgi:mannose-6-phosphate isomerase-like protein (cupin superfamily)
MKRGITFLAGMAAGLALAAAISGGARLGLGFGLGERVEAQAAQKNTSKVVLENDRVIVKDATFYPGDTAPGMHTHKLPHVGVIIDGGTLVMRSPDGKTETMNLTRGGAGYREANVTHEPIAKGTSPVRVIEVELK